MRFEGFDGALQVHAARAFHQHHIARAQILREPLTGGFGIAEKYRRHSAGAGGRGQMFRIALHGDDQIETSLGGSASTGDVQRGAVLAHLQHFAGHQDAAARGGPRGQGVDHGAQCFGIRVVAVVENGCAADLDHLAALVAGREGRDRLHRGIEIDARFERHGESGHGIRRVVRAEHVQREVALTLSRAIADVQALKVFVDRENLRVGAGAAAEIDHAAVKIAAKLRGVGIVAVEKGNAVRGQRLNQFEFGARDAGLALFEVLNVRRAHVGDHAPVGRGDARQRGDLAQVIHAHLDDGDFVFRHQAQQLQRAGRIRCSGCPAT